PVTKWQTQVETVERMPELLRQAFRVSTTGAPGPVHLEFSGALGYLVEEQAALDSSVDVTFGATPAFRPVADEAGLERAVKALSSADAPVIVAGQGVMSSGAEGELLELAE